ncbi:type I restriction-modification system subunit M [bacterium]|nr:type I restriction-modification system subunit M [bacterium]NUN47029.1 SAM-dependent DNA methyltransferase [bacterium]
MLTNPDLKSKIDSLWDKFWSGGIANPITAIEQMSYLIFLKRLEDMDNARAAAAKRRNETYRSVFHGNKECRWSHWSQLPGDQMLKHVRDKVFDFLREVGGETSTFTQHMEDAVFVIPKASLLQEAVKIIDDMHISEQNVDVQGDLYEYLLSQLTTSGKNGQFRTPRHIIRMITKLVDPKIGQRICDPACGTGGFLVAAYEQILEENTTPDLIERDEDGKAHHLIGDKIADKKLMQFLKSRALTGYDFDSTMVRIGAMNLMLHGIDNPRCVYTDTMSKAFTEKSEYDVILANPPFKGSIDKSDINERFTTSTTKTELLFIELIYGLLKNGGKAGVIVPDGVLFGTSNAHVDTRKIIVDKCKLEGVISMPSGVFKPYAGVSTAVLIFQKGGTTKNVWFYDMEADGFSLDDKRQRVEANDIPDILKSWGLRNSESPIDNQKFFKVTVSDIRANKYDLSISRYKEIVHTEIEYEKPDVIMNKIVELEKGIAMDVEEIREMMK